MFEAIGQVPRHLIGTLLMFVKFMNEKNGHFCIFLLHHYYPWMQYYSVLFPSFCLLTTFIIHWKCMLNTHSLPFSLVEYIFSNFFFFWLKWCLSFRARLKTHIIHISYVCVFSLWFFHCSFFLSLNHYKFTVHSLYIQSWNIRWSFCRYFDLLTACPSFRLQYL